MSVSTLVHSFIPQTPTCQTCVSHSKKTIPVGDLSQKVWIPIPPKQSLERFLGTVGFPLRDFTGNVFGGTLLAVPVPTEGANWADQVLKQPLAMGLGRCSQTLWDGGLAEGAGVIELITLLVDDGSTANPRMGVAYSMSADTLTFGFCASAATRLR